jgi:hypothetical protein
LTTRVLKYRLPFLSDVTDIVDIDLPASATPLHVAIQNDEIHMWAAVDETDQTRTERFRMYATGRPFEGSPSYLGTVHYQGCVWHIFLEHTPNTPPTSGAAGNA